MTNERRTSATNLERGGFWSVYDAAMAAPPRSPSEALRRHRLYEAAHALGRGDYGPARAVLAEA